MIEIEVRGLDEALAILARMQEQLQPGRAFGEILSWVLDSLKGYAASITPVVTGRLQAGHTVEIRGLEGILYNPVPYAGFVHAMGGHRAFYDRTMTEAAPAIMGRAVQMLAEDILR